MKKAILSSRFLCALCVLIVLPFQSAFAAGKVPQAVLDLRNSVVKVKCQPLGSPDCYTGSGFAIGKDTPVEYIVTNLHVVEANPDGITILRSDNREIPAEICLQLEYADLCVLSLDKPLRDVLPVVLYDEMTADVGEAVYALGFPGAADVLSDTETGDPQDVTITDGIVSAHKSYTMNLNGAPVSLLQINAAINHGNSGGPLVNEKAQVVGVNTLGAKDAQNINGAVSIMELVSELKRNDIPYISSADASADKTANTAEDKNAIPAIVIICAAVIAVLLAAVITLILLLRKKVRAEAGPAPAAAAAGTTESKIASGHEKGKASFRKRMLITGISAFGVLALSAGAFFIVTDSQYNNAIACVAGQEYVKALDGFSHVLRSYKSTDQWITYANAGKAMQEHQFDRARELFASLGSFNAAGEMRKEVDYQEAVYLLTEDYKFEDAHSIFENLGEYKDSKDMVSETDYQQAVYLLDQGNYDQAKGFFLALGSYKDSAQMALEADYRHAIDSFNKIDYATAYPLMKSIGKYKDSEEYVSAFAEIIYKIAVTNYKEGRDDVYKSAEGLFKLIDPYKDSSSYLILMAAWDLPQSSIDNHTLEAQAIFEKLLVLGDFEGTREAIKYRYFQYALEGKWSDGSGHYFSYLYDQKKGWYMECNIDKAYQRKKYTTSHSDWRFTISYRAEQLIFVEYEIDMSSLTVGKMDLESWRYNFYLDDYLVRTKYTLYRKED